MLPHLQRLEYRHGEPGGRERAMATVGGPGHRGRPSKPVLAT